MAVAAIHDGIHMPGSPTRPTVPRSSCASTSLWTAQPGLMVYVGLHDRSERHPRQQCINSTTTCCGRSRPASGVTRPTAFGDMAAERVLPEIGIVLVRQLDTRSREQRANLLVLPRPGQLVSIQPPLLQGVGAKQACAPPSSSGSSAAAAQGWFL